MDIESLLTYLLTYALTLSTGEDGAPPPRHRGVLQAVEHGRCEGGAHREDLLFRRPGSSKYVRRYVRK